MTRPSQARMRSPGLRVGYRPGGNLRARDIDTISRFIEYAQGIGCTIRQNGYGGMVVEVDAVDVEPSLDTALFGIALHPDHAEILQRRVEIKQPAGSGVLQRQTLPDTELQYSEINEEEIDGVYTVYLVYDLDEETMTVAWEPEDAKSNVRLYDISVKKHDPEPPETDPTFSATVKRIYRPGDVDIEAVWIELPPKEEGP